VGSHLLKLQRLQNKVPRNTGNLPRHTPTGDVHISFTVPYLCGLVAKLCRGQAIVILDHGNINISTIGQGEARHRKCKNLVADRHTSINCLDCGYVLERYKNYTICCTKPGLQV